MVATIPDRRLRAMRAILAHLGEPTAPPRIAPARGPPLWGLPDAGPGDFDPHAQPAPEYEFDQHRLVTPPFTDRRARRREGACDMRAAAGTRHELADARETPAS